MEFSFLFSNETCKTGSASDKCSDAADYSDDNTRFGGCKHSGELGCGPAAGVCRPYIESDDCIKDWRGFGIEDRVGRGPAAAAAT